MTELALFPDLDEGQSSNAIQEPVNLVPDWSSQEVENPLVMPEDIQPRKKFYNSLWLLFGRRGDGKSLLMTAVAKMMQRRYRDKGFYDRQIWANYDCKFADRADPFLLDWLMHEPWLAMNKLILIDEIADHLPSVRETSRENRDFANFVRQIRKTGSEMIMATQMPQEVSRKLLRQIDIFVRCRPLMAGRVVRAGVHDFWGGTSGNFRQREWPPRDEDEDSYFYVLNTNTCFGDYDTYEMQAAGYRDNREEMLKALGWNFETGEDEPKEEAPIIDITDGEMGKLIGSSVLDRYKDGYIFDVSKELWRIKGLDDDIRSTTEFVKRLRAEGFNVMQQHGKTLAEWKK